MTVFRRNWVLGFFIDLRRRNYKTRTGTRTIVRVCDQMAVQCPVVE